MTQTEARELMLAHQRAAARYRREGDNVQADAHMARAREFKRIVEQ